MSGEKEILTIESQCQVDELCVLTISHKRCRHARGCGCRPCVGRRSRRKGKSNQANVFHALDGIESYRGQMTEEERWSSFPWAPGVRFEVKTGARSVPVWVRNAIAQVKAAHNGNVRPALIIRPKGDSTHYVLMSLTDFQATLKELGKERLVD